MGDPDNQAYFQETTYPIEMLGQVMREQKAKLKKDIPDVEKEVLKGVL